MAESTEETRCDVCSTPNPTWEYPAADFMVLPISVSQGAWLCCDLCAALIERRDPEGLAVRAVDALIVSNPELGSQREWCLQMARQIHADFWENRTGNVRVAAGV